MSQRGGPTCTVILGAAGRDFHDFNGDPATRVATPAELRHILFAAGPRAPKVETACRFPASGPRVAAIGRLADAAPLLDGTAGTQVRSP